MIGAAASFTVDALWGIGVRATLGNTVCITTFVVYFPGAGNPELTICRGGTPRGFALGGMPFSFAHCHGGSGSASCHSPLLWALAFFVRLPVPSHWGRSNRNAKRSLLPPIPH